MRVKFDFELFYFKLPRFRPKIIDFLDENYNLFRKLVYGNSLSLFFRRFMVSSCLV